MGDTELGPIETASSGNRSRTTMHDAPTVTEFFLPSRKDRLPDAPTLARVLDRDGLRKLLTEPSRILCSDRDLNTPKDARTAKLP